MLFISSAILGVMCQSPGRGSASSCFTRTAEDPAFGVACFAGLGGDNSSGASVFSVAEGLLAAGGETLAFVVLAVGSGGVFGAAGESLV